MEALDGLLRDCSENVRIFVDRRLAKHLLKLTSGVFKRGANRVTLGSDNASTPTNEDPGPNQAALSRNRLLCLSALLSVGTAKPEELARREVMALMASIMAPENDAKFKEMAAKILISVSKVLS